jgi:hypothetical protein
MISIIHYDGRNTDEFCDALERETEVKVLAIITVEDDHLLKTVVAPSIAVCRRPLCLKIASKRISTPALESLCTGIRACPTLKRIQFSALLTAADREKFLRSMKDSPSSMRITCPGRCACTKTSPPHCEA